MNLELKTKIVNGLNNLKYILLVVSLVAIKILFDTANYEIDNKNNNKNDLTINVLLVDSAGSKLVKVETLKLSK
tara:strand:+ start:523 stop:744 length:222 start_codon:yes stop_codon:yes gene_type:complete